jgi:hypothetical protein
VLSGEAAITKFLLSKFIFSSTKQISDEQTKTYTSITMKNDTSITVIYHAMSLTVLYLECQKHTPLRSKSKDWLAPDQDNQVEQYIYQQVVISTVS